MSVTCPNCNESVPGLYSSESNIRHCGCFYEGAADDVLFHVSSMFSDEYRSDWDDTTMPDISLASHEKKS